VRKLIIIALVGFVAQLVDGSLGMGYGVTSSTMLVLAGLTPLAASASVHFSELGTNLASGLAHWRLRNVDWPVVARIAGPGAVGAFLGATVLSALTTEWSKPVMSVILALLGFYIIVRFVVGIRPQLKKRLTTRFLVPLGLFAGFVDATGGGGWGPVATPALLSGGRLEPRKASLGFLIGIGAAGINWSFALALLAGGLVAAPIAAYLVKIAPAHVLGVAVGGLIVLTNLRTILGTLQVPGSARIPAYLPVLLITAVGLYLAALRDKRRTAAPATDAALESVNA
jgi:uncharacterized membrane protein YfcA